MRTVGSQRLHLEYLESIWRVSRQLECRFAPSRPLRMDPEGMFPRPIRCSISQRLGDLVVAFVSAGARVRVPVRVGPNSRSRVSALPLLRSPPRRHLLVLQLCFILFVPVARRASSPSPPPLAGQLNTYHNPRGAKKRIMSLLQTMDALLYAVALYRETLLHQCGEEAAEVVWRLSIMGSACSAGTAHRPPPR